MNLATCFNLAKEFCDQWLDTAVERSREQSRLGNYVRSAAMSSMWGKRLSCACTSELFCCSALFQSNKAFILIVLERDIALMRCVLMSQRGIITVFSKSDLSAKQQFSMMSSLPSVLEDVYTSKNTTG